MVSVMQEARLDDQSGPFWFHIYASRSPQTHLEKSWMEKVFPAVPALGLISLTARTTVGVESS